MSLEMVNACNETTVDQEIFTIKIICVLNFCVKNSSLLDNSAM